MINQTLLNHFETSRKLEKEKEIAFLKLRERINENTKKYAVLIINEQLQILSWLKKEVITLNKKERLLEIIKTLEKELKKEKTIIESELVVLLSNARKISHKELLKLKNEIHSLDKIDLSKYGIPGLILVVDKLVHNKTETSQPEESKTDSADLQIRISEIFVPNYVMRAINSTLKENMKNYQIIYLDKNYFESVESKKELQTRLIAQDYSDSDVQKYLKLVQTTGAILINEDLIKNKELLKKHLMKKRFSRFLDLLHPEEQTVLRDTARALLNKLYILEEHIIKEPLNLYRSEHFTNNLLTYAEKQHQKAHKILSNLLRETRK